MKKEKMKKSKSDSDGVTIKRSYYTFSKYYPGGGSSQEYRKVMHETPDERRAIKIILSVFALLLIAFIGYFTTCVGINVSNAPTTGVTQYVETTEQYSEPTNTDPQGDDNPSDGTTQQPSSEFEIKVTQEEPEREVNVTSVY